MSKPSSTIAITGANGFLGSELVRHFSQAGWHVRALVRDPTSYRPSKNVTAVAYDLTQPLAPKIFVGVDYLVHAAYVKQQGGSADALDINVAGAERLLAAASAAGIKRRIFISSMSAHDEATSTYGLQKLAIERLFNGHGDTSIRSGLIIGNGGLVKQMADFMRSKHAVPLIGGGKQPLQTIGVYDLAQVVEAVLAAPKPPRRVTVATPEIYSYKEFYRQLGKRLGIHFVYVPVPYGVMSAAFKLIELSPVSLSVNRDNLIGLKNLRSAPTSRDLAKLGVTIDDLPTALSKSRLG